MQRKEKVKESKSKNKSESTDLANTKDIQDKENNTKIESKNSETDFLSYGVNRNVFLTVAQVTALKEKYPDYYEYYIENLSEYIRKNPERGAKYKSHYMVLLRWMKKDLDTQKKKEVEEKQEEEEITFFRWQPRTIETIGKDEDF
jgi:hypothetical protein